jgi:hypothetical protein
VRSMHMIPAHSLEEVTNRFGNSVKGFILPRGAALLPRLR